MASARARGVSPSGAKAAHRRDYDACTRFNAVGVAEFVAVGFVNIYPVFHHAAIMGARHGGEKAVFRHSIVDDVAWLDFDCVFGFIFSRSLLNACCSFTGFNSFRRYGIIF